MVYKKLIENNTTMENDSQYLKPAIIGIANMKSKIL